MDEVVYDFIVGLPQQRTRSVLILAASLTAAYIIDRKRRELLKFKAPPDLTARERQQLSGQRSGAKVGVNAHFFAQLKRILPVCVPGLTSPEFGLLAGLAGVLVARTWLDIWFSSFNGVVVRAIVSRDWELFVRNAVVLFGVMMWPMSIVNNSLKLTINMLALRFRERLTRHAHRQYLRGLTFYQVANLDNRIQNADQLLTQDIDKFAETLAHLYSDIAKPLVDIGLFAYKLGQSVGGEAPLLMIAYFASSGTVLRYLSPPFGKCTTSLPLTAVVDIAIEQNLEGQFRYAHSRIIAHSEEIAFYRGSGKEQVIADNALQKIVDHLKRVYALRFTNGIVDSVLVKYCATQLAFFILSRPVFGRYASQYDEQSTQDDAGAGRGLTGSTRIMEDYSRNSGYLINLSQAVGRIVLAGRDLTRFAGFTSRVSDLLDVLEQVNAGRYQRTMHEAKAEGGVLKTIDQRELKGRVVEAEDGDIAFDKVPIVTPSGDVLVRSMSFKVSRGMNCLITGPNGSGKSSLFRVLGGLWPLFDGTIYKPAQRQMFYVPQRPYLPLGTLQDQLTYPDTAADALAKGVSGEHLQEMLRVVHLEYLLEREGGWHAVRDWTEVLSGGEKQRVAMARLFYHRPLFAILDECTSAVSIDVEGEMYRHAKHLGITLFTVSHRPSLFQFHEYLIRFDGEGGYSFGPLERDDPFNFKNAPSPPGSEDGDGDELEERSNSSENVMFYYNDS